MTDSDSLLPFVPPLAIRQFMPAGAPPAAACAHGLQAAVLFADVSGFTAMVERLSAEGQRGAEGVQQILNRVFGPLADLIDRAGGEVLKFPGDAALALFTAAPEDEPGAPVRRAAGAALAAIRGLDGMRLADGTNLHIRIAITAGPVSASVVGGVGGRFELLVQGTPLADLAGTLALARPGEAVLSAQAADLAGSAVAGERRPASLQLQDVVAERTDVPVLPSTASLEALGAFVPRAVQARIAAGQRAFLAEFRRVSVVFVNVRGLNAATQDALNRMHDAVAVLQTATARFGGSVNQVVEDDKGTVAVLGFGVALHAFEDDAARAVLAALEIREQLTQRGIDVRIGIASDRVFTGKRGSERRAEYAMIGAAVNLAARLMQWADPLLCDAATRAAARRRILFESLAPLSMKGYATPVQAYRPRAARPDAGRGSLQEPSDALIGRSSELGTLARRLNDLDSHGQGGVIFIEGEPGIGKTRLIRQLLTRSQATSVRALVGHTDPTERQTSLLAWRPIVAALLGNPAAMDEASVKDRLTRMLGTDAADRLPLLDALLPMALTRTTLAQNMTAQGRAMAVRSLVCELLGAATKRGGVLLVLEDGHWLDVGSWELLETAARQVPGLLVVVSLRPMRERPEPYRRLLEDVATTVVRLDALDPDETLALVCRRLDVDSLPEEVAAFIHRQSEGHPLFSEELAYAMRDRGLLAIEDGECRLTGSTQTLEALQLSQTVSSVVSARIDALTPQQQLTLKVASIFGRQFELDGVREVHPLHDERHALEGQLEAIAGLGLLRRTGPSPSAWDFGHALLRDAAYELLPTAQRCELHLGAAQWLERIHATDPARVRTLLGHHYECAEHYDEAIEQLALAGDQALARWENAEAAHLFERVLSLDERRGAPADEDTELTRASWERKYGDALCMLGDHARGAPVLKSALRRLRCPVPEGRGALLRAIVPRFLAAIIRAPRPRQRSTSLDARAEFIATEASEALSRLGASAYPRGEATEGLYLLLRSLTVAGQLGPGVELARVYMNVGNLAAFGGRRTVARAYARMAVEMAEQAGDLATLGAALVRGQTFEVAIPNFDALPSYERGLAILEEVGDHYMWEEGAAVVANFRLMQGDLQGGAELSRQMAQRARDKGSVVRQLWGLAGLADALLRLGQLDAAISTAQEALALSRSSGALDPNGPLQAVGALASAWLRRHGVAPAATVLEAGHRALAAGGWVGYAPQGGYVGLIEAHLALLATGEGDAAEHRSALTRLARQLRRTVFARPVVRQVQLWLDAERLWLRGRNRRAERAQRAAIACAESCRLPFEGARLRVQLAERLAKRHPERAELLAAAQRTFASLHASFELDNAQRLAQ